MRTPAGIIVCETTKDFRALLQDCSKVRLSPWWSKGYILRSYSAEHLCRDFFPPVGEGRQGDPRVFCIRRRKIVCRKITTNRPPANIAGSFQTLDGPKRNVGDNVPGGPGADFAVPQPLARKVFANIVSACCTPPLLKSRVVPVRVIHKESIADAPDATACLVHRSLHGKTWKARLGLVVLLFFLMMGIGLGIYQGSSVQNTCYRT